VQGHLRRKSGGIKDQEFDLKEGCEIQAVMCCGHLKCREGQDRRKASSGTLKVWIPEQRPWWHGDDSTDDRSRDPETVQQKEHRLWNHTGNLNALPVIDLCSLRFLLHKSELHTPLVEWPLDGITPL
jgi:hypothetical protein